MDGLSDQPSMLQIDRQARAWQKRLVGVWRGPCPRLFRHQGALVAALFLAEGMTSGPLPDDRLDLVRAATRREEPSREAFVTLALVDYVEDLSSNVGSAHLPYQLAWARAGYTLSESTGLPGGIFRARWPEAPELAARQVGLKPFEPKIVTPEPEPEPVRFEPEQMTLEAA